MRFGLKDIFGQVLWSGARSSFGHVMSHMISRTRPKIMTLEDH